VPIKELIKLLIGPKRRNSVSTSPGLDLSTVLPGVDIIEVEVPKPQAVDQI